MDIRSNVSEFVQGQGSDGGRKPNSRYASFDYCYNYFQSFRESGCVRALAYPEHMQSSCLQLGFYLASWGMLRGSSFLLQKSVRHFEQAVYEISAFDEQIWSVDVDSYSSENIALLIECSDRLRIALGSNYSPSRTLLTKIMLGVFGNVPALDQYVCSSLRVNSLSRRSLERIGDFYQTHRSTIEAVKVFTLDFSTGKPTSRRYTRAKIVDMACFIEGLRAAK